MGINIRRMIIGEPIPTQEAFEQRVGIPKALAIFSSDALSSSAYATEAILLVLIAAGAGALGVSWYIALGIAALLLIVASSYYQTIHAYPNGGGAYIVSRENLGALAGLTAASALLIDYVLTVAVSVSAGVAALTSAFPSFSLFRIEIALVIVGFITVMNLRGVKESGTFFSIPTYGFIIGVLVMIGVGVVRVLTGNVPTPDETRALVETTTASSGLTLFLVLRAYAAGCTALTGVEAISNGVPTFKPPESKHAGFTLAIMVVLLCTMFLGITFLANNFPVEVHTVAIEGRSAVEAHHETVLSQIAAGVFGTGSILYYYMQFVTLFILSLAANTAFAGFPRLASLISRDRYLPRQLTNLGDRLVFSNGIKSLAFVAAVLIILFDAREHNLLPLYAVGVFISFTLSQSGMVVHWLNERHKAGFKPSKVWRFKISLNAFGALCTFIVLCVLVITKFIEGAWMVLVAIPILMFLFTRIHRHYEQVAASLTLDGIKPGPVRDRHPDHNHVPTVVLMNSLNRCSLQALEFAMRISDNVTVCAIEVDPEATKRLEQRWKEWRFDIPLVIVPSPYREIGGPLIRYLHERDMESNGEETTLVVLPEFVVVHWWERLLHNQSSVAIRDALYRDQVARGKGRPVINVPYRIGDMRYEPSCIEPTATSETPVVDTDTPTDSVTTEADTTPTDITPE